MHPAIALIVSGPEAWTPAAALTAAGIGAGELAALGPALGDDALVSRWELPDGEAWTLTPLGAWTAEVRLVERITTVRGEVLEVPRWVEGRRDVVRERTPTRLPRYAHEYRMAYPERVEDPLPGPEYLMDPVSERPIELCGSRVAIARKLRGKR